MRVENMTEADYVILMESITAIQMQIDALQEEKDNLTAHLAEFIRYRRDCFDDF